MDSNTSKISRKLIKKNPDIVSLCCYLSSPGLCRRNTAKKKEKKITTKTTAQQQQQQNMQKQLPRKKKQHYANEIAKHTTNEPTNQPPPPTTLLPHTSQHTTPLPPPTPHAYLSRFPSRPHSSNHTTSHPPLIPSPFATPFNAIVTVERIQAACPGQRGHCQAAALFFFILLSSPFTCAPLLCTRILHDTGLCGVCIRTVLSLFFLPFSLSLLFSLLLVSF